MRALLTTIVFLISISVCGVLLVESLHYCGYGHLTRLGLHADLLVDRTDVGIEGISKMYGVKLTNYGFLPVSVSGCDFISDAGEHGTSIAYAVEKWNTQSVKWKPVVVWDQSSFCHPYPLGIVKAQLFSKRLWPGQSVTGGGEATAARDGFELGDSARFVAFAGVAGNMEHAFPTGAFRIDEHPLVSGVPFRVQH
jgi:hypothetical protein